MPTTVEALDGLAGRLDAVRDANLAHHVDLVAAAATRGVQVLGLGELFSAPYFALHRDPMWHALAEDAVDGPSVTAMRAAAREHGMVLVAPIYEIDARSGKRFNTAVVIDAAGAVLGKYRKMHIPRGGNELGDFDEAFYYDRGDGHQNAGAAAVLSPNPYFPVFATAVAKIGIATCYDRHFEGVIASLAAGGAELVFSPAVTFGAKSRRLWELEFAVDAARHRVFIGGSNRSGSEAPWGQEYFGASHFVGPDGQLADQSDHAELVVADLDLASLGAPDASGWDLGRDARPETYGNRGRD